MKETNEAFAAFLAHGDLDNMTEAQMEYTLNNNCCAGLFFQYWAKEKIKLIITNYKFNRTIYPSWSKGKCFWEASRETFQLMLDILGLVPVVGEVADITNGVIYTIHGDGVNASLSFAGAIPIAGWGATGAKFAIKTVASVGGTKVSIGLIKGAGGLISFGKSSKLRKVLNLTNPAVQAHHIIPRAKSIVEHKIVQEAAKSKNAFHIDEALNGIAVASWRNQPNHFTYSNKILEKLNFYKTSNPNATPQDCYNFLTNLINDVRIWVVNNPNSHLNDIVLP